MNIHQWNNLKKGDVIYSKATGRAREVLGVYQTMEYNKGGRLGKADIKLECVGGRNDYVYINGWLRKDFTLKPKK